MIAVRLRHLPPEAACETAVGGSGWTITDYLISDVVHVLRGEAHPARPKVAGQEQDGMTPDRRRKLRDLEKRAKARREQLNSQG